MSSLMLGEAAIERSQLCSSLSVSLLAAWLECHLGGNGNLEMLESDSQRHCTAASFLLCLDRSATPLSCTMSECMTAAEQHLMSGRLLMMPWPSIGARLDTQNQGFRTNTQQPNSDAGGRTQSSGVRPDKHTEAAPHSSLE